VHSLAYGHAIAHTETRSGLDDAIIKEIMDRNMQQNLCVVWCCNCTVPVIYRVARIPLLIAGRRVVAKGILVVASTQCFTECRWGHHAVGKALPRRFANDMTLEASRRNMLTLPLECRNVLDVPLYLHRPQTDSNTFPSLLLQSLRNALQLATFRPAVEICHRTRKFAHVEYHCRR
jgi:hypothetical protein